ncbi:metal-dependent hydrolase [Gordonia liuliyuniae]|uniref:Metal-dependent hydrolase n=1 Tax=Gordonia liuliyuniae TaxID=2911517 RepID=A0ABS9IPJ6_9ACTN|nr:metal-dependent hydrolase [Gordonia liuliyuniae]MCF8587457.1 metal-dependent hydrolase [Gordonia liuliyuniae]
MTSTHAARPTADTDPGEVELHARNVEFDLSNSPLHWIPTSPVASNLITSLNLLLPEGERWFVTTFNEALPMVKDAKLAEDIRGFVGQEAMHAEAHDKAVHTWLEDRGVDATAYLKQMEWVFQRVLGPREGQTPAAAQKHLVERLWLIAAIEHYTALLGDFALNSSWVRVGADPDLTDLYMWHGAEEVEHRSVAHEAAAYFGDSPIRRARAMSLALPFLLILLIRSFLFVNSQDPTFTRMSLPKRSATYLKDYFVQSRKGTLPKLGRLVLSTVTYFKPGFHPSHIGDTAQAVAYLASSPGARRAG